MPEVWSRILSARNFVVAPHLSFRLLRRGDAELRTGGLTEAKLAVGPLVFPEAWIVETHDRDDKRLALCGAEGFERDLMWDYTVQVGEAGPGSPNSLIHYKAKLPGKRSILRLGIGTHNLFVRRHLSISMNSPLPQVSRWIKHRPNQQNVFTKSCKTGRTGDQTNPTIPERL